MAKRRKSGVFFRQTATHPFGRLTLAGFHFNLRIKKPMPLRFWDTYAIVYVLTGRARFRDVDGLDLPMTPGALLLMFPGHGYHYDIDPDQPYSEFWLHFEGPVFDLMRDQGVIDPAVPIHHLEPVDAWLERFEGVARLQAQHRAGALLRQTCHFLDVLADAVSHSRRQKQTPPDNLWLAQAEALLEKHPVDANVDWTDLAMKMGLSADRFRKKFKQFTGTSPANYLVARRLEKACTLLQDRSLGLKEIATRCGFCDVFHFSKRFKQRLQLTPTEYRNHKLRIR
jgi:AraC-like DNA-binding protein